MMCVVPIIYMWHMSYPMVVFVIYARVCTYARQTLDLPENIGSLDGFCTFFGLDNPCGVRRRAYLFA